MSGEWFSWLYGLIGLVVGAIVGAAAWRNKTVEIQRQTIEALRGQVDVLRSRIAAVEQESTRSKELALEAARQSDLAQAQASRERLGMSVKVEEHEDNIIDLGRVNLRQQREIDAQRRRIKQLEDALERAGGKIPEPNGG